MSPRPFPFPLRIGTDICQISRIFKLLASPRGTRFIERVLAPEERAASSVRRRLVSTEFNAAHRELLSHSSQHVDWAALKKEDPGLWKTATFLAGRFAAKEAAFKAHPSLKLSFHNVLIVRQEEERGSEKQPRHETGPPPEDGEATANGSGPPIAVIRGDGGEDQVAHVSISHDGEYATAVCMGFDPKSLGGSSAFKF